MKDLFLILSNLLYLLPVVLLSYFFDLFIKKSLGIRFDSIKYFGKLNPAILITLFASILPFIFLLLFLDAEHSAISYLFLLYAYPISLLALGAISIKSRMLFSFSNIFSINYTSFLIWYTAFLSIGLINQQTSLAEIIAGQSEFSGILMQPVLAVILFAVIYFQTRPTDYLDLYKNIDSIDAFFLNISRIFFKISLIFIWYILFFGAFEAFKDVSFLSILLLIDFSITIFSYSIPEIRYDKIIKFSLGVVLPITIINFLITLIVVFFQTSSL